MKKILFIITIALLSITAGAVGYVLAASDISDAQYLGQIVVTNNSTAATNVVTACSINSSSMADQGFANDNITDTALRYNSTDVAYMPGYGANPWVFLVSSIPANSSLQYELYSGDVTGSTQYVFTDSDGIAVDDDATLEAGSSVWSIEIKGYFDATQAGYIWQHDGTGTPLFYLYSSGNGTITAMQAGEGAAYQLTVDNFTSGEHTVEVYDIGVARALEVDGDIWDTASSNDIIDRNDKWYFASDGTMLYVEHIDFYINYAQVGYWAWEYNSTLTDQSGNGNTATPSWITAGTDADVSAELVSFMPVDPAQTEVTFSTGNQTIFNTLPDMPSQMYTDSTYTYIPGAEVVNALLDTSSTPRALWWFPFVFLGIALFGLMLYEVTGSEFPQAIVCACLLSVLGIMNIIPFWPSLLVWVPFAAIIFSKKHYSWG